MEFHYIRSDEGRGWGKEGERRDDNDDESESGITSSNLSSTGSSQPTHNVVDSGPCDRARTASMESS